MPYRVVINEGVNLAKRFGASYTLCVVMLDEFLVAVKQRKKKMSAISA